MTKVNNLDLSAIHPKKGAKYSPNLYQHLTTKRSKAFSRYAHVYKDKDNTLWLGYLDEGLLIGARLAQVLRYGAKAERFAYTNLGPLNEVPDFWQKYVAHGRCAIDTAHTMYFIGDDARWSVTGNARTCLWCGQVHQTLHEVTETRQVTRQEWVAA